VSPAVLVADIGGTNARVAVHACGKLEHHRAWPTASTGGLAQTLSRFRAETGARWSAACVAIAGPASDETVHLTNADWSGSLSDFDVPARFVNDLEAAAWSLDALDGAWDRLRGPAPDPTAPAAILGLGTGLGEAYRVPGQVIPGEGGHRAFAPSTDLQRELAAWLRSVEGRETTWEHVLCGDGLGRIAAFLAGAEDTRGAAALSRRVTAVNHPVAHAAQALYARCCAAEARAQALQVLARGGVWLMGGMPARISDAAWRAAFEMDFLDDGAHRDLLAQIPVLRVTHPHANLVGAATLARQLL